MPLAKFSLSRLFVMRGIKGSIKFYVLSCVLVLGCLTVLVSTSLSSSNIVSHATAATSATPSKCVTTLPSLKGSLKIAEIDSEAIRQTSYKDPHKQREKIESIDRIAPTGGGFIRHQLYKDDMMYQWFTNANNQVVMPVAPSPNMFASKEGLAKLKNGKPFSVVSSPDSWHEVQSLEDWTKEMDYLNDPETQAMMDAFMNKSMNMVEAMSDEEDVSFNEEFREDLSESVQESMKNEFCEAWEVDDRAFTLPAGVDVIDYDTAVEYGWQW